MDVTTVHKRIVDLKFLYNIRTGEKFSLTPLWVRPGGVNHNDKTIVINPPGVYRGRFTKPPLHCG